MELRYYHFGTNISALQELFRKWLAKNFKPGTVNVKSQVFLVLEEASELAEAALKHPECCQDDPLARQTLESFVNAGEQARWIVKNLQGVRQQEESEAMAFSRVLMSIVRKPEKRMTLTIETEAKIKDAIADIQIATITLAEQMSLPADRNLAEVAEKVLARDWKRFPFNGVDR